MSDTADRLIDIYQETPDDLKPEMAPVLAAIMRHSMAIDKLTASEVDRLKADHAREVEALNEEITDLIDDISHTCD